MSATLSIGDLAQEFDPAVLARVLERGRSTGAGFSEIFIEDRRSTSASLDDGTVDSVSNSRSLGAGIRVISGDTTGYAHTTDLTEAGLLAAADAAARAASRGDGGKHTVSLSAPRRQIGRAHV